MLRRATCLVTNPSHPLTRSLRVRGSHPWIDRVGESAPRTPSSAYLLYSVSDATRGTGSSITHRSLASGLARPATPELPLDPCRRHPLPVPCHRRSGTFPWRSSSVRPTRDGAAALAKAVSRPGLRVALTPPLLACPAQCLLPACRHGSVVQAEHRQMAYQLPRPTR